jgi:tetratricopeptide (TPR) repeat protein
MDFVTFISVLAGIVTIVGGIAGFLRYLHTRHRKVMSPYLVMSPYFLNLNLAGRHQEALDAGDQAINLKETAPAYTNRGWALQALKHYSQALQAHEKALALDPNFAPAYKGKGDDLFALGDWDHALVAYDHTLLLDPGFAPAYKGKGDVLQKQGRFQEAQQAYEKVRQIEQ